ncbi:amidohydrolase [Ideonella sp. B508-1]|uniref:amidohydrolase family protein n=1 Tax=Ideonella sp. B508-1 TaxID=137716 RepID=UPI000349D080|nr:amidohydrolase family protein [Ideonella sp. B508-1]
MSATPSRRQFNLGLLGLAVGGPLAACASTGARMPVTAVDCHAHVFRRDLPMPDRRRAPSGYDATPQDYLHMLDTHGLSHGVLIQPSFLGTDNSYMVEALRAHPDRLRGVAVVETGITPDALQALAAAGVVGIRLNLIGLPTPQFNSAPWRALLPQLKELQWQVEVHQIASQLEPVIDPLLAAGLNVVVDHFGRPDETLGVNDPGFRYLLSTGRSRQVWVKLSAAYRNGGHGAGEATALAALPLLKASHGLDRLIWGSDWPHTLFEHSADYGTERHLLDRWLPDPAERAIVLRSTPQALFGFAA